MFQFAGGGTSSRRTLFQFASEWGTSSRRTLFQFPGGGGGGGGYVLKKDTVPVSWRGDALKGEKDLSLRRGACG